MILYCSVQILISSTEIKKMFVNYFVLISTACKSPKCDEVRYAQVNIVAKSLAEHSCVRLG